VSVSAVGNSDLGKRKEPTNDGHRHGSASITMSAEAFAGLPTEREVIDLICGAAANWRAQRRSAGRSWFHRRCDRASGKPGLWVRGGMLIRAAG
jgi:hypothetical protein